MKKTIAILALAASSAYGQNINWGTLQDTAGNTLADAQSGTQVFDISTDGSGCFLEVSWGVTGGGGWNVGPNGGSTIANTLNSGVGGNTITFTLLNATADWTITSQPNSTGASNEFGTLSSDQNITATAITGLASLDGSGTNTVTYGTAASDERGQFSATIAGATTFTYAYDSSGRAATNADGVTLTSGDPFGIALSGINAASHVPEPSTALLGVLAGLGFIARRRRA